MPFVKVTAYLTLLSLFYVSLSSLSLSLSLFLVSLVSIYLLHFPLINPNPIIYIQHHTTQYNTGIDQAQYEAMTNGTHPVWGFEYLCPICRVNLRYFLFLFLFLFELCFIFII